MRYLLMLMCSLMFLTCEVHAEQKVVLISGATQGIGVATAKAFQKNGWKVWAGYRKEAPEDLKRFENVRFVYLDVVDDVSVQAAVQMIIKEDGKIDALINNAGYGVIGAEETITIEESQALFDVNFFGVVRLIHAVAPYMRKQSSGHIINISSTSGVRAIPGAGMYAASKFALEGICESLAVTLSPWNIQVSIVEPGSVNNDWAKNCIVGSRQCDEQIYTTLTNNLAKRLVSLSPQGQSCDEIGQQIVEIAQTSKTNMRYQTSEKVKDLVAKKFVDVTGNAMRDEQLKFFELLTSP